MTDNELFSKALILAANKHVNQKRKNGDPYIYHPIEVANLVRLAGYSIKYQIVALLHDTIEDTCIKDEEIEYFGQDVLKSVKLLTRTINNEETYISHILCDDMAAVVKNADKICNLKECVTASDKEWAKRYVKKAKRYYYNQFSKALDETIEDVEAVLCEEVKKLNPINMEDFNIINNDALKKYNLVKEKYIISKSHPISKEDVIYYHNIAKDYFFCFSKETEKIWRLCRGGWIIVTYNPITDDIYNDDIIEVSRENVTAAIKKLIKQNYFYDFVDTLLL